MDIGAGPVRAFTGKVASVSGGTGDRAVEVGLVDAYQSLDQSISWGGVGRIHPAPDDIARRLYLGMYSTFVTDRILRHCGWYTTPPRLPYIALLVPATGSMWPLYGTAVRCERNTGSGQFPRGFVESWGRAVTQVDAEYRLHAGYSLAGRGRME